MFQVILQVAADTLYGLTRIGNGTVNKACLFHVFGDLSAGINNYCNNSFVISHFLVIYWQYSYCLYDLAQAGEVVKIW